MFPCITYIMLNFYKNCTVDAQNCHFSMLEYILNYCFKFCKVGENRDFWNCFIQFFDSLIINFLFI